MSTYHWSEDYVLYDLPGCRGHAYLSHAILRGGMLEIAGDGYIAQERWAIEEGRR